MFNISHLHLDNWMVELGMWSLCVCLWSAPLLAWTPSVVSLCSPFHWANLQGWCWQGDCGVSSWSGSVGLVLFHRSFIGSLKLLSSLAGLFQGQAGCKRTCLGGVVFASVRVFGWGSQSCPLGSMCWLQRSSLSLLQGILPRKIDSKAEVITLRSCAVLAVSGWSSWAFLLYRNWHKTVLAEQDFGFCSQWSQSWEQEDPGWGWERCP